MGQILEKIKQKIIYEKFRSVLMIGNGGSGRTTMLYKWKTGLTQNQIPSIGFNVEQIEHQNISFQMWDIGGGDRIRPLWKHYMAEKSALITVVDSSVLDYDPSFLQTSIINLFQHIETPNIPFLILANKSDKCKPTDEQILQYVGVERYKDKIKYTIIRTNCFSGEGLTEALDWLAKECQ